MHAEEACSLRYVSAARFVGVLDLLPAHAICRLWMLRWLDLTTLRCEQSRDDVVRVPCHEIVNGAKLRCPDGGSDIAVATHNDSAGIGPLLLKSRNDVQAATVVASQIHHRMGRWAKFYLGETFRDRFGGYDFKTQRIQRAGKTLPHRIVVQNDQHQICRRCMKGQHGVISRRT